MKKKNIEWLKDNQSKKIWQIYRRGMEYAFLSSDNKQCNQFVWCKDFLQDIIYSCLYQKKIEIYKFEFDPIRNPKPCLEKTKILVANSSDARFSKKIINSLDILNQIENELGIKKSILKICENPPENYLKCGVFLFEGSKRWINSPPMLSLYTLLLRVGCIHTIGVNWKETVDLVISEKIKPYQRKDGVWLKHAKPGIEKIIKYGDRKIFYPKMIGNYPQLQISSVHNDLGITGFAADMQDKIIRGKMPLVPYWHSLN